jgi:hypothetical protein
MPVELRIGSITEGRHDLQIMVYDKNDDFTGEAGRDVGASKLADSSPAQNFPPQHCLITLRTAPPHDATPHTVFRDVSFGLHGK